MTRHSANVVRVERMLKNEISIKQPDAVSFVCKLTKLMRRYANDHPRQVSTGTLAIAKRHT